MGEDVEVYGDEAYLWEVSSYTIEEEWVWYVCSNSVFDAMKEAFRHKAWHSNKGLKVRMLPNFSTPPKPTLTE